jgi:hypothetical protein
MAMYCVEGCQSYSLRLEGVSFAYLARPDVVVLRGLTLDVPAGEFWLRGLRCGLAFVQSIDQAVVYSLL